MRRRRLAALGVLLLIAGGGMWIAARDTRSLPAPPPPDAARTFASNDPVERGCAMPKDQLRRIWMGYHPDHSEDVFAVPLEPNYTGSYGASRQHSGPWDYLQQVPLVLYGPERIRPNGVIDTPAGIVDLYPTYGELTDVDLQERRGQVLDEALKPGVPGSPKLIVTIVWDGVGRNVLERWPNDWPNLARLEREGTSYLNAELGSSPSITPATHSSIGTGTWPRYHEVVGIKYQDDTGEVRSAFAKLDPRDLVLSTFGDQIDRAYDNRSLVGMIAWHAWHLGMLSHGTANGGDKDLLALIRDPGVLHTDKRTYTAPDWLLRHPGFEKRARELDRSDGEVDGRWMGREIGDEHENPAWINYERDILEDTITRLGFGADEVPDLLMVNFKPPDLIGHRYSMESKEMQELLRATDAALGDLIELLDERVGDYVVVVTADHGHTPLAETTGAWPISNQAVIKDIENHFNTTDETDVLLASSAVGFFVKPDHLALHDASAEDIAEFLNDYTIEQSLEMPELPEEYAGRGGENAYAAAFTGDQLPEIMECAFGERFRADPDMTWIDARG